MALESLKTQLSKHVEDDSTARKIGERANQLTTACIFTDEVVRATPEEVLNSCFPSHLHTELYCIFAGISAVFKRHDLEHWLCFGSAIGALRHGSIIPWDDDIDMAMWWSDLDKLVELEEELREAGVGLSLWWHVNFQVWTITMVRAYLLKENIELKFGGKTPRYCIDIFFMEKKDGMVRYTYNQYPRASHDQHKFYPLQPIKLGPVSTFIPSDAEDVIASEYGARWDKEAFLQVVDHTTSTYREGPRLVFSDENLLKMSAKYDEEIFDEFQLRLNKLEEEKKNVVERNPTIEY